MKLKIIERLQISWILPKPEQDSFTTFKLLKSIRSKIFLTPEEVEEYDVKSELNEDKSRIQTSWNEAANETEFDIDFTELEIKYLNKLLNELSKNKMLSEILFDMCDKYFIMDDFESEDIKKENDNEESI